MPTVSTDLRCNASPTGARRPSPRRRSWRDLGVLLTVLAIVAHASPARAGALEDGQAAYDAMDYDRAATSLAAAAGDPALGAAQRAHALLLLGMVRLTLGDQDLAERHFVDAVTLDPQLELPPDLSPKVRAIIDDARGQARDRAEPSAPPPASTAAASTAPAPPLAAASATPPASVPVDSEGTSVWSSPWLWGGVAAVAIAAAVVGTVVIMLALNQEQPPPDEPAGDCDAPDGSGCVKVTF